MGDVFRGSGIDQSTEIDNVQSDIGCLLPVAYACEKIRSHPQFWTVDCPDPTDRASGHPEHGGLLGFV